MSNTNTSAPKYIDATPSVFPHPSLPGWVVTQPMRVEVKKDGTPNRARLPIKARDQIHEHTNGHVRVYRDGILFCEAYNVL